MLTERMGETVTLEAADGTMTEVPHVLLRETDASDQSVMDVQTRFINQARYKGDNRTLTAIWPKSAPHDLMDAHVWVRGERYRVYADPFPLSHTPTGYDTRVTIIRSLFLYDVELLTCTRERDQWGAWRVEYGDPVPAKANLLRLSDTLEAAAAQRDMARVALIELPPGTWRDEYVAFRLQGHVHRIESHDFAGDVVVVAGTREVIDAE